MSKSERQKPIPVATETRQEQSGGAKTELPTNTVETRLKEAEVNTVRFVKLEPGTKACYDHTNLQPESVGMHHGIYAGDGLLFVDLDSYKENASLPAKLPPTFSVETPHGGEHRYYIADANASNATGSWGELRADNQYVVGPGSKLEDCDKDWHDCSKADEGHYRVLHNRPIAYLDADILDALGGLESNTGDDDGSIDEERKSDSTCDEYDWEDLPDVNDDLVSVAEANIRDFRDGEHTSHRAFEDILTILQGGEPTINIPLGDRGKMNRSGIEYVGLSLLYGVMRHAGEPPERARNLTYAIFTRYCKEIPSAKDGRRRKWLRGEKYREDYLDNAIKYFDKDKWRKWRRRSSSDDQYEHLSGEYSDVTYDLIQVALNVLCDVMTLEDAADQYGIAVPDSFDGFTDTSEKLGTSEESSKPTFSSENYPSKQDVVDIAQQLDPTRAEKTHENSLSRLQREDGIVKMAYCGGNDYRYYPAHLPDPSDAEYVKVNGEERPPQL